MRKPVDRYVKAMNRCHHGWREAGHLYFGMAQVIAAIACTSWLCTASGVLMEWRIDPPGVPFGQDPLTVADALCASTVGGGAFTTTGIHGEYDNLYGYGCFKGSNADTVIFEWSCNGINWNAFDQPQNAVFLNCLGIPKNPGPPCCGVGNPINPGYGNKYQEEVDYRNRNIYPRSFVRTYNSKVPAQPSEVGMGWRTNFDRSLSAILQSATTDVYANRYDGKVLHFSLMKNGASAPLTPYDSAATWVGDADISDKLARVVDGSGNTLGWTYYLAATEETESYDSTGHLMFITSPTGATLSLAYNPHGQLDSVTDSFGRQLGLSYDTLGRIAKANTRNPSLDNRSYSAWILSRTLVLNTSRRSPK